METGYTLSWDDAGGVVQEEEVICGISNEVIASEENVVYTEVCEEVVVEEGSQEMSAADNVMYLTEDNMLVMQSSDGPFMECQVTEEVVAQDWSDCQELVVGSVEQVGGAQQAEDDVMIPLPTDQDQYLASRPYPCDFCSRRFRKKANLMNHMVAHQTDRPHGCNLCGARYIRKCDLMNHLKIHAYVPDTEEQLDEELEDEYGDRFLDDDSEVERIARGGRRQKQMPPLTFGKKRRRKIKEEYDDTTHTYLTMDNGRHYTTTTTTTTTNLEPDYTYDPQQHQIMVDEEGNIIQQGPQQQQQLQQQQQQPTHHYPITDPRKPFVCQHCGVGFAREKALASHARMHAGDSPFECRLCDEMFWDVNKMREHMRVKHGEGDFNTSGHSSGMGRQQTDEDEYSEEEKFGEFFCGECGESFSRSDQLKRHARMHTKVDDMMDLDEYMHVCNVCGDSFAEPLDLLAHAECHARSEPPRCSVCSAAFASQQDLAAHVAAEHAATLPPNACLLCGRICRDKRALIKHNVEHTREKAFTCPQCNKAFNNRARLKRHLLSHRDKAVTCDVCSQSFPDGRSLMNHRHSHSSVSGRQFPCEECGKSFGSRSSQQIHVRIHTGERPYGCRFCWKAFADGGTLRKHERIHTGEKPYACAVCPRAFNQRVVLREHIRSHHSGPDPNYTHTTTPYCCNVCSDMFATSQDLIVHLIHHCDLNTAMRRQPQVGPRKYKRRRKLKPHEIDAHPEGDQDLEDEYPMQMPMQMQRKIRNIQHTPSTPGKRVPMHNNMNSSLLEDELGSDEATDSDESPRRRGPKPAVRAIRRSSVKSNSGAGVGATIASSSYGQMPDDFSDVFKSFSSTIENLNNLGPKPPKLKKRKEVVSAARPKMIHTQKTKISVETNEGGKIRHKTKTLVTRTQQQQQQQQQPADQLFNAADRIRPRTKNVSYHILSAAENGKLPLATFPADDDVATAQAVSSILEPQSSDPETTISTEEIKPEPLVHEARLSATANGPPVTTAPTTTPPKRVPMPPRRVMDPGTKIIKIVKGGMIISKKKPAPVRKLTNSTPPMGSVEVIHEDGMPSVGKMEEVYVDEPQYIQVKQEVDNPLTELAEISMQHANQQQNASSVFKCEMCSAVFSDRPALLEHVPVHI